MNTLFSLSLGARITRKPLSNLYSSIFCSDFNKIGCAKPVALTPNTQIANESVLNRNNIGGPIYTFKNKCHLLKYMTFQRFYSRYSNQ